MQNESKFIIMDLCCDSISTFTPLAWLKTIQYNNYVAIRQYNANTQEMQEQGIKYKTTPLFLLLAICAVLHQTLSPP